MSPAGMMQTNRREKMIPSAPQSQHVSICAFLHRCSVITLLGVGDGALAPIPRTPQINLGLPLEEADLEFEQLQELEQELEGKQEYVSQEFRILG